ncbi:hypothetical protein [Brachyspira intermedia]|uniref:hypothetical protein n=1 Tax=Brachyspira intermedia TaxID=84377 RepID=UPI0030074545
MSKKIFLSLLFVLALAVSCNKNNPTSPTTTKVTYQDYSKEIVALDGINIVEKGTITLGDISFVNLVNNTIDIEANGPSATTANDNTTTTDIVEKKMQDALNAIQNPKITYNVKSYAFPLTETDTVQFNIEMTPRNGEFDVDSFKNEGFTDTVNTTAAKITLSINVSLIDCKWTDSYPSFKLIK